MSITSEIQEWINVTWNMSLSNLNIDVARWLLLYLHMSHKQRHKGVSVQRSLSISIPLFHFARVFYLYISMVVSGKISNFFTRSVFQNMAHKASTRKSILYLSMLACDPTKKPSNIRRYYRTCDATSRKMPAPFLSLWTIESNCLGSVV